jgi:glycosyltransferase involved in cell wall biosynthesis
MKNENQTFVSVVLPAYNAAAYISETIESVLKQTYRNFEFIIINDGSTDTTESIVLSFASRDSRIKYFAQENRGLVYTLNYAISLAQSNFIARVDADDICDPSRLEKQLFKLKENDHVAVVGTWVNLINETGKRNGHYQYPITEFKAREFAYRQGNPLAHPTVLFKKDIIIKLGGYHEKAKLVEDYDLWLRVLMNYEVVSVGEYLLDYRIHSSSVSKKNSLAQLLNSFLIKHWYLLKKPEELDYDFVLSEKFLQHLLDNFSNLPKQHKKILIQDVSGYYLACRNFVGLFDLSNKTKERSDLCRIYYFSFKLSLLSHDLTKGAKFLLKSFFSSPIEFEDYIQKDIGRRL